MQIFYEGENIGSRRVDFLVEDEVLVELKALTSLLDVHLAQGLNYLVAYKLDKGLLLNFGSKSLEIKRLRHPRNKMENSTPENNPVIHKSINPSPDNPNQDNPN